MRNATTNASANAVAPSRAAKSCSRTRPRTRESIVAAETRIALAPMPTALAGVGSGGAGRSSSARTTDSGFSAKASGARGGIGGALRLGLSERQPRDLGLAEELHELGVELTARCLLVEDLHR